MPSPNKWRFKKVTLDELQQYDENPRDIDEDAFEGLMNSIERFGYIEPIVWNERTGRIVGGHQRLKALKEKGVEMATVMVVDMDDADELAANLTLNNPAIEGEWDDPVNELLAELKSADEGLYESLNMFELEGFVESLMPKSNKGKDDKPGGDDNGIDEFASESDTACPCCGFEWKIDAKDIQVMSPEELEAACKGVFPERKAEPKPPEDDIEDAEIIIDIEAHVVKEPEPEPEPEKPKKKPGKPKKKPKGGE